jgi:hypothetical protein
MLNASNIQPNLLHVVQAYSRLMPKNVTEGQKKSQIGVPGKEFKAVTTSREALRVYTS